MAWHTVAFEEAVTALNTDEQLDAVADPVVPRQDGRYIWPLDRGQQRILGAYVGGASLTRARLVIPTNQITRFAGIVPLGSALLPGTDPNVADFRDFPITIQPETEIELRTGNDLAMGTEQHDAILHVAGMEHSLGIPAGERSILRCTAAITATANAWSAEGALTFDETLDTGRFAVIGAQGQGTTLIAFRLVFPNQLLRPGFIGMADVQNRGPMLNYGGLGVAGIFHSFARPQLQVFCSAADTAQVIWLMVVRVG